MPDHTETTPPVETYRFSIWTSGRRAKQIGATHHAFFMGIIPGYFGYEDCVWVPLSDLLNPLEDLLTFIWGNMRALRGEEADFSFKVGRPIKD